jgi:predicted ATPase
MSEGNCVARWPAREGRGLLLTVSGEAGIGQTSLVEDFLAEVAAKPDRPIVARGRCSGGLRDRKRICRFLTPWITC